VINLSNKEERRLRGIARQIGLLKREVLKLKIQAKVSFLAGLLLGILFSILINIIFWYLGIF